VRLLAELGANVKTPMNGCTPVFIAAQNGHAKVVRLLAELGANVKTPMNNGFTPLAISVVRANNVETTQTLLLLGAPVTARDLRQRTHARGNMRQLRADIRGVS